jgi:hypothetical protein
MILAWKERFAAMHLPKNTAHRPEVHSRRVALRQEHNLGRSIPPGHYILCENGFLRFVQDVLRVRHIATRKAEIANLHLAVFRQQNVAWLQIAVRHTSSMQMRKAS